MVKKIRKKVKLGPETKKKMGHSSLWVGIAALLIFGFGVVLCQLNRSLPPTTLRVHECPGAMPVGYFDISISSEELGKTGSSHIHYVVAGETFETLIANLEINPEFPLLADYGDVMREAAAAYPGSLMDFYAVQAYRAIGTAGDPTLLEYKEGYANRAALCWSQRRWFQRLRSYQKTLALSSNLTLKWELSRVVDGVALIDTINHFGFNNMPAKVKLDLPLPSWDVSQEDIPDWMVCDMLRYVDGLSERGTIRKDGVKTLLYLSECLD